MLNALIAWFLTGGGDPSLMLAQGKIESHWDVTVVSRAKGGRYCGVFQCSATSEADCRALQHPITAVLRYRAELRAWRRATRGDLRGALRGYGCGSAASRPGGVCRNYDGRVLALAQRFHRVWLSLPRLALPAV